MKHINVDQVPPEPVDTEGAEGATIRWLIAEADGAKNFCMRYFELAPNGFTPHHTHCFEHQVFILAGHGHVICGDERSAFRPGDAIYIPPNVRHQFRNSGSEVCKFLCMVPTQDKCTG